MAKLRKKIKIDQVLPRLLKMASMSLSELSRASGCPVSTLGTWLQAGSKPKDISAVAAVAEILEVPLSKLLFDEVEQEPDLKELPVEVVLDGYYRLRLEKIMPSGRKKREN